MQPSPSISPATYAAASSNTVELTFCGRGVRASDVLPDNEAGLDGGDGVAHGDPEVRAGAFGHPGALACVREVLAGGAAGENVDGLDGRPVDPGHVAVIGDAATGRANV